MMMKSSTSGHPKEESCFCGCTYSQESQEGSTCGWTMCICSLFIHSPMSHNKGYQGQSKDWAVSFTGNKENLASSSTEDESTDDFPLMPLCKFVPTPQPCPALSPLDLDRFKRAAPREKLTDEQSFPLAFIYGNPTLIILFSEAIFSEAVYAKAPT